MKKRKGSRLIAVRSDELHRALEDYIATRPAGETDMSDIVREAVQEWLVKHWKRYADTQNDRSGN